MTYVFTLYKYNNLEEKVTIKSKNIKIVRACQFVAKEYLIKKYSEYDFVERES
jgi:hypothetical protein